MADGLVGLELVQVVDHQPQPLIQRAQILEQTGDDRRAIQSRGGGQLPNPIRTDPRPTQRVENRQPECLGIVLPTPHRHPRRAIAETLRRNPRAQQERLSAARRRGHVHHALPGGQKLEQAWSRDQPPPHTKGGVSDGLSRVGHDTYMVAPPGGIQPRSSDPSERCDARSSPARRPWSQVKQDASDRQSRAAALRDQRARADRPDDHASVPAARRLPPWKGHAAHRLAPRPVCPVRGDPPTRGARPAASGVAGAGHLWAVTQAPERTRAGRLDALRRASCGGGLALTRDAAVVIGAANRPVDAMPGHPPATNNSPIDSLL